MLGLYLLAKNRGEKRDKCENYVKNVQITRYDMKTGQCQINHIRGVICRTN
jgi:hypothetical protein